MSSLMVVEDNHEIRTILSDLLESEGYQVTSAINGREALEKLSEMRQTPPGLILLDLRMPEMDGFQFRKEQKQTEFRDIPVLVLTAQPVSAQQMESLDVSAVIFKPVKFDSLLTRVEDELKSRA